MINNILNIVNQQNGKQEVFMDGKPISTDPAELARHYEDAIEQICNATINRILMEQQVDTQDKQASLDRQPRQP